jgi:hypothetical protein
MQQILAIVLGVGFRTGIREPFERFLENALGSDAQIGGMEVRLMALAAVHRIGLDATAVAIKERAVKVAQSYALGGTWEDEARDLASDAAAAIRDTIR